ncbi:transposase [Streptomyces sp. G-G2]|uniref:transposase n=1 Tax=Streptomyces sp. G-G2 TaxID=3046201 RepID=UPI0024BB90F3|nr:transposase [Streptomyces sp. G-G2]MDJ0382385.1 transposase [Streptomyces sp. G-G2]
MSPSTAGQREAGARSAASPGDPGRGARQCRSPPGRGRRNHDRLGGDASLAAACGVSPVEHSSGKSKHRRLNRGGNRQANAALYLIVLTRLRWDERTRI